MESEGGVTRHKLFFSFFFDLNMRGAVEAQSETERCSAESCGRHTSGFWSSVMPCEPLEVVCGTVGKLLFYLKGGGFNINIYIYIFLKKSKLTARRQSCDWLPGGSEGRLPPTATGGGLGSCVGAGGVTLEKLKGGRGGGTGQWCPLEDIHSRSRRKEARKQSRQSLLCFSSSFFFSFFIFLCFVFFVILNS